MTKKEFIKWLKDEVTMSGSLNITLTDAEYERICEKEINMLYQLYPVTVKHQYCIIPRQQFYTREFRNNRTIQFPSCVLSVGRFEEMKRKNSIFGINDPDFSFNKTFQADMWLGSQMNMDSTMFRTIQWSLWDQMKVFTLVDIKRSWNEADKTLLVLGHDPTTNVFCEVYTKCSPVDLYGDPWVRQWCAAKCKLNVAKLLGTFTTNLIGGVSINTNMYSDEANKELEECKEYFKTLREADHFFLTTP